MTDLPGSLTLRILTVLCIILCASDSKCSMRLEWHTAEDETSASADTTNRILFKLDESVDRTELCFFDMSDTNIHGYFVLNPAGWDIQATDIEDLVEDRIYGCFVSAHYDQSGETFFSDTVFLTREALLHDIMITSAP